MRKNKVTLFFIFLVMGLCSSAFSQVTEEWVKIINGPVNGGDHAKDITTDAAGNVYVTGFVEITTGNPDCYTVKYSSDGTLLWERYYSGSPSGIDYGNVITVDENENVYVGGFGAGSSAIWDLFILKYNANGDTVWTRRWGSPIPNYSAYAYAITLDNQDNVYVTGFHSDGWSGGEFLTLKYNSSGILQWYRTYKGPGVSIDYAYDIKVDNSGNVFITGFSGGENNFHDMTTIKYSSTGDSLWVRRYNGSANDNDYAYRLDFDSQGNVYVTGTSVENGTGNDITIIKYSTNGDVLWIKHYNGPGNGYDGGWVSLKIDDLDNIFIASNHTTTNGMDCVTLKYNSDGTLLWTSSYNGPGNGGDLLQCITLDDSSNVYVSGFAAGNGLSDIVTIKYDSSGNEKWVMLYNGPGSSYDGAQAMTIDGNQNIFVAGYTTGSGTDYDYTVIKYSQPVVPVELSSFAANINNNIVILNWITASETNNYGFEVQKSTDQKNFNTIGFVNGSGTVTETRVYSFVDESVTEGKTFYRLKQIDFDGSYEYSKVIEVEINSSPVEYALHQNYPNPFNPSTKITFSLTENAEVLLKVYNILGQEVSTLINGYLEKGMHQVDFDGSNLNSGIYFYEINVNSNDGVNFSSVKKMMLTK